jgi:hypothetical protein
MALFQRKQLRQCLAVLRLADLVGVVVRAALHQHKLLGFCSGFIELAAQVWQYELVLAAMHHQQR